MPLGQEMDRAYLQPVLALSHHYQLKGEVSSKMTYNFNWPFRTSIFFENFL